MEINIFLFAPIDIFYSLISVTGVFCSLLPYYIGTIKLPIMYT